MNIISKLYELIPKLFETLVRSFRGLVYGLILGFLLSVAFGLSPTFGILFGILFSVLHYVYCDFLEHKVKHKFDKIEVSWQLNTLEKRRYEMSVQEYVSLKRDLEYKFYELSDQNLKNVQEIEEKYGVKNSLESLLINEYELRIIRLIKAKLFIEREFKNDENIQKLIIERIILLFETNIIVENFGIDNKPSKIELLEARLDFLLSYDNWKDEKISQIIKITENEKINELLSDKKTINSEMRSIYLKNIEDVLEPSRFRMQPDTYLETKQYLINTYNVVNKLNLDLPETIDEDEIFIECKFRINYIYSRFIDELIKKKKWQIKTKSGNNNLVEADLDDGQILALKDNFDRLNIVSRFFEIHNVNKQISEGDYSFLKHNIVCKFLMDQTSNLEEVFEKFQDEIKDGLDLKVLGKDILPGNKRNIQGK